jgi:hypothetical protein
LCGLRQAGTNQVIETVTGEAVTVDKNLCIKEDDLQKAPGQEKLVFDQEKQCFPEVALVSTQAKREYLRVNPFIMESFTSKIFDRYRAVEV